MKTPDTTELLQVWERGAGKSPTERALLLMEAALPDLDREQLAHMSVGQRDGLLLTLREALFGPEVRCLTECTNCGEKVELDFHISDIRAPHGETGRPYRATTGDYEVRFRLPDSADLLALQGEPPEDAEHELLTRCILNVRANDQGVEATDLPASVLLAVNQEMSEADPQAEIVLEVSCPGCSSVSPAPFDIVAHLWAELDAWAGRMFREVHALAAVYKWSEADILRMSAARRHFYLDLLGS